MSGPALKEWDSHHSIHEAALGEASDLNRLLRECLENGDRRKALDVAYIAVEHWETRTLEHASAEEEGLYRDIAERTPEARDTIIRLTRDHTLMRRLVGEIRETLASQGATEAVLEQFQALIWIDLLHNEDEGALIRAERERHGFA